MPTKADMAHTYASVGWRVFPVVPNGKQPAVANGVHAATTDLEQVVAWWEEDPDYNIGIATGVRSGVVVVDVDQLPSLAALNESPDTVLPDHTAVRTPKGVHLYYQSPDGGLKNSVGKLAPGVDTRGDGGYVLAPPSTVDGQEYRWLQTLQPRPLPEWVAERLASGGGEDDPFTGATAATGTRATAGAS